MQIARFSCPSCGRVCKAFHTRHKGEDRNRIYRRYECSCGEAFSTIEEREELVRSARNRQAALRIKIHRAIDDVCGWSGIPWNTNSRTRQRNEDDPQS